LDQKGGNFSQAKSTGEQSIENSNLEIALWFIQVLSENSTV